MTADFVGYVCIGGRRYTPLEAYNVRVLAHVAVDPETGCHIWTGTVVGRGHHWYGIVASKPRTVYAHRLTIETFHGPIPSGHVASHLCGRSLCVNPVHLTTETQSANVLRAFRSDGYPLAPQQSRITSRAHVDPEQAERSA